MGRGKGPPVTSTNDSFIDEVSEAVRRERLNVWFRRWGWAVLLGIVAVVGFAAWTEWRQAQARSLAELRGEVILTALELPDGEDRLAALAEVPLSGEEGVLAALLLAAEQEAAGDAAGAAATLGAVAADGDVAPLYRDLAAFKAQLALGDAADPAALEALTAPGGPFRLLAIEQLALLDLSTGDADAALGRLGAILEDADVMDAQRSRVTALMTALGAGPEAIAGPAVNPSGE